MLAVDASLDLTLAVVVLIGQPICMIGGGYKLYFSAGFFAGRWYALDKFLLLGWFCLEFFNIMWVPIQFVYRYAFVCLHENADHSRRVMRRLALVSVLFAVIGTLFCIDVAFEEEPRGVQVIQENGWLTDDNVPFVTGGHKSRLRIQLWCLMWLTACLGAIVVVAIFEIKIAKNFKRRERECIVHRATQRMHAEFHRALLAMAICPIVTAPVPIVFFFVAMISGVNPGPSPAFLSISVSAITLFNPLTTMFFMRSYRDAILSTFGLRKSESEAGVCDTGVTGLSVNTHSSGLSVGPRLSGLSMATTPVTVLTSQT